MDVILIFKTAVLLTLALVAFSYYKSLFNEVFVYEHQRGLLYTNGKFERVLESGKYKVRKSKQAITLVDMRETVLSLVNQELICGDNLSLRFSVAAVYKVIDPAKATHTAKSYYEILYLEAQLALRDALGGLTVEEVLAKRTELSDAFSERIKQRAVPLGLEVSSAGIKDITFPADVKKIYSMVAQAEKAGLANLAKARSEVASMRALANAAKMVEGNPNLMALRTLQSVNDLANTTGNTIVFGLPPGMAPLPVAGRSTAGHEAPPDSI